MMYKGAEGRMIQPAAYTSTQLESVAESAIATSHDLPTIRVIMRELLARYRHSQAIIAELTVELDIIDSQNEDR